jgi:serine/threonine protein kinase
MSPPQEPSDDAVGLQPGLTSGGLSSADAPTKHGGPEGNSTSIAAAPQGPDRKTNPVEQTASSRPLPTIPGHRVLGELGRGGMGVVYKAEQLALGRIVALKVLTAGVHASPAELARFRSEAESAARLSHPHIVQVYEVGEADGCPFFSLEFVAGGTLGEKLRAQPLSPPEAARLIVTIARAVQFAHDQEIIHRDLKPANILLTLQGEPKIADFGLAKRLSGDSQTKTGEVMGTPSYMAPEQATGVTKSIGPACDVYSLGAIFFEMLTGRPPFYDPDPVETILQVISDEPVSIRRLSPNVPRDLQTICHKCLEKQPKKRYPSAGELADDLDRYLSSRPILARPTPTWERVVKWTKRRPGTAGMIAVIVVAVVTIVVYGIWKNGELRAQRDRALHNFNLAIQTTSRRIDRAGQSSDDLLRDELQFLTAIGRQTGDSPEVRYERAIAARMSGDIFRKLGETKLADKEYDKALNDLAALIKGDPHQLQYPREQAGVFNGQGQLRADNENFEEAEKKYEASIQILKGLRGTKVESIDVALQLASIEGNLAVVLNRLGKTDQALVHQERLVRLWNDVLIAEPEIPEYHRAHAIAVGNMAAKLLRTKPKEAEQLLVEALRELEQLPANIQSEQTVREFSAAAHVNLAIALNKRSAMVEGQAEYQKALEIMKKLVGSYPDVIRYEQGVADIHYNLAFMFAGYGKFQPAILDMEAAAKVYASLAAKHPDTAALNAEQLRLEGLVNELKESAKAGMP